MRKTTFIAIALIFVLAIAFSGCGGLSYADHLDKEKKGIEKFLNEHGYVVRTTYPDKGIFAPNEFYKDDNGVYIHVSDTGTQAKPEKKTPYLQGDRVFLRFGPVVNLIQVKDAATDTLSSGNAVDPKLSSIDVDFDYGNESTYTAAPNDPNILKVLTLSSACVEPLDLGVRFGGVVSLIVPFEEGSSMQQSSYYPLYISNLTYCSHRGSGVADDKKK